MATTIVNPAPTQGTSDNGNGFIIGVVLFIAFILVLLYFGLPYVQRGFSGNSPQVNIPNKIDVNVKSTK